MALTRLNNRSISAITDVPLGSVVQVISVPVTSTISYTGLYSSGVGTLMSASITPRSSSNKILVMIDAKIHASNWSAYLTIYRDNTKIYMGDAASNRPRVSSTFEFDGGYPYDQRQHNHVYLDSPNTTSTITYYLKGATSGSDKTVYLNRSNGDRDASDYDGRSASSITLMEIKA